MSAPTDVGPAACDVCLRQTPPDVGRFEGWRLVDIEAELGLGSLCWVRGGGRCTSIGWERVRALENLIREAISERPS